MVWPAYPSRGYVFRQNDVVVVDDDPVINRAKIIKIIRDGREAMIRNHNARLEIVNIERLTPIHLAR